MIVDKNKIRKLRKNRIKCKIQGTQSSPRLSVFRSAKHIYAQVIDDSASKTLCSYSDVKLAKAVKTDKAKIVGQNIATKCLEKGVKSVKFDRGGFKYHGRIKKLAEAAREKGLKF